MCEWRMDQIMRDSVNEKSKMILRKRVANFELKRKNHAINVWHT